MGLEKNYALDYMMLLKIPPPYSFYTLDLSTSTLFSTIRRSLSLKYKTNLSLCCFMSASVSVMYLFLATVGSTDHINN